MIEQTSKGIYVSEKNVTFGAYKWKWLELYKAGRETNTIEGYRNILKNHTAALDGLKLLQIKKTDIQTWWKMKVLSASTGKWNWSRFRKEMAAMQ